jgi:hypothetical protein
VRTTAALRLVRHRQEDDELTPRDGERARRRQIIFPESLREQAGESIFHVSDARADAVALALIEREP